LPVEHVSRDHNEAYFFIDRQLNEIVEGAARGASSSRSISALRSKIRSSI
jgi:hypothetical protein